MENKLEVKNLAQIKEGTVEFGDFTLIVGPQASGKSIFLQLLKLVIDSQNIAQTLITNGFHWGKDSSNLLEIYLGESMSDIWTDKTRIKYNDKPFTKTSFLPKGTPKENIIKEKLFYVPAQRIVSIQQGWPRNFNSFENSDPYVLKSFSETLRVFMEKDSSNAYFKPATRTPTFSVLKDSPNNKWVNTELFPKKRKMDVRPGKIIVPINDAINSSIFYGARVEMDMASLKKRFLLHVGNSKLPFMNWSAGQKEFMPLLLSFYHLMPGSSVSKNSTIKWVVIEEPEMGLHSKAIQAVMLACLDLVARGYKVIVSTHSAVLLEFAWAMNYIKNYNGNTSDLFELFSISPSVGIGKIFRKIIEDKIFKTYYFQRQNEEVYIKDISSLDAGSADESIANWGGLSGFAGKASEIVSKLASAHE